MMTRVAPGLKAPGRNRVALLYTALRKLKAPFFSSHRPFWEVKAS